MKKFLILAFCAVGLVFTSCKKDDNDPEPPKNNLRSSVDYNSLTATTPYNSPLFYDSRGDSTVDRTEGHTRLKMFKDLDTYGKLGNKQEVDANKLKNMFSNSGNPFDSASFNTSGLQIRNVTATSSANADAVRTYIESHFTKLAEASKSYSQTASKGTAGVLDTKYLVDTNGIEWIQVISKTLIGSFQLDYIGNNLLGTGLDADNSALVSGKNYSQLEHNWDEAYGLFTLNPSYALDGTPTVKPKGESFIGSYVWEYNKEGFSKIHPAFLKGRAAIINNDKTELKVQADLIRKELEKAIASAALGYLGKYKSATATDGSRLHAISEGAGFIYSLRFCKMHGADDKYSDDILNNHLLFNTEGFWEIPADKILAAETAIKEKFGL